MEMASSVEESATQLLLETDPSARQPRTEYLLRYQGMAHSQLEHALSEVNRVKGSVGEDAWRESLKKEGSKTLEVLIAESNLARDRLQAAMR